MDMLAIIDKLRQMTAANGASKAEETIAAEKIGRFLMQYPDLTIILKRQRYEESQRAAAGYGRPVMDDVDTRIWDLLRGWKVG